ncbi:sigma-70 family RNA polymerase sigma factor [Streptococcus gordonii]|uniref:sigma-70 family RNA polymerase sigma factor n=1 Tax=Streptococcus TaxID=1301 RepID=UPI002283F931|nr:sigma-70 family RNA polymerase sigma factor [Streptococcus gordonii]MCY7130605.1 sigma-70 family RNA polymerase sigma factor [Streptococcus gordonii]MCY7140779.1 sigma-70 family RNA polymerase sigma factor [Streptococcus gordonii]
MDKKEYYLYVQGKAVPVSKEVYQTYWKITDHEKYLKRKDKKYNVILFSSLDHDGHFVDNFADKNVDIEKLVETKILIETLRNAISKLNDEEREIIERLYFKNETLRSVAKLKNITHPALIKRRNKILEKLKKFIEEL